MNNVARLMPGGVGAMYDQIFGPIRITGYGRIYQDKEVSWGFKPLQHPNDGMRELSVTKNLPEVASALGIDTVLAPTPDFGRSVARKNLLPTRIPIKHGEAEVTLLRGRNADVCVLEPGETYGISAAGCIVAAIYYPGNAEKGRKPKMLAAHLGLKCLINREKHIHESVVDVIMGELSLLPHEELEQVHVMLGFPINPLMYTHEWDDKKYGPQNEEICGYIVERWGKSCIVGWDDPVLRKLGRIDIEQLARVQFQKAGIKHIHTSGCLERYLHSDGKPLWYSTRGPFKEQDPPPRNLVLITRLQ